MEKAVPMINAHIYEIQQFSSYVTLIRHKILDNSPFLLGTTLWRIFLFHLGVCFFLFLCYYSYITHGTPC